MLTLGLLALLYGLLMISWGPSTRIIAATVPTGPLHLGKIVLAKEFVWSFAVAMLATFAFVLFFRRTKLGLGMRAAYDNQVAARCLGVNSKLNSQIAWVLCAIIATVGGILIATVHGVSIALSDLVMVVLAVVLIGGMDSFTGCVFGGLILAIGANLASYYLGPHLPGIEGIFGMILILVVLLIRPNGLMGTKPIERV
jgi:branched-chain amino acid transport system permease protein